MKHRGTREEMKGKHKSLDRISALPQDTVEKILTLMPIRDAIRTSIFSKKWRYCWTGIPKLVFNDSMIVSSRNKELDKYKFVNAIFHVFLQHTAPILEFSLCVTGKKLFSEIDRIILYLSRRNNVKRFIFETLGTDIRLLPRSLFSLQGLEHLDLSYCEFELPLLNKGFSKLKSLRFFEVDISSKTLQGFLTSCPLLEKFTWTADDQIELTQRELVELFKSLPPSIQVLEISQLYIEHLGAGRMPHKLPISQLHLRILVLHVCFLELSSVLCVISSSPNLEKIKMKMCWHHDQRCPFLPFQPIGNNLPAIQDYTGLNLDHLKEMEITNFNNHALETEFVKLIMAKSPVLEKARIELNSHVSVEEEVKMLRGLVHMPFPRASPAASVTIGRPED